ncbi:LytR family transcriptional regulator [Brasilonema octagenarum UFV-E1]|uniref:LytR family transcriptional regulator n=1 Tax=Brasilonema sennae CENA114 TaxID=415709 RepID=A0A856MAF9_9CYAN|nr:LCP family protein [Brasilonema sennae]QDL07728.1 LytR family transcriptional regulator [Brasilonema sennae CENA114]QDL14090.1 LytR family transcriptional regulator [Brasilonema octagenarum UFV-E1]
MTIQRTSAQDDYSTDTSNSSDKNANTDKSGRWLWFWVAMSGIAMVSATAGALLAVSLTGTPLMQASLSPDEAAVFDSDRIAGDGLKFSQLTRPVNILIMGMSVLPPDVRNPPAQTKNLRYLPQVNSFDGLADVMLLTKFDPEHKKVMMLSIPRDTRTQIDGHGIKKINSANVIGGPALTAKTVSSLLDDVGIDRYMRINVLGVAKLIDALGGVTVYVPKDMKYQDDSQHLYINLKKGKQHLNGDQALQLLRFRHDENGDIGRIQRQQMVMRALMDQSVNPATVAQLPKVLNVVKEHIDTNLTLEELLALVGFGVRTNRSNMQMLMLPGQFGQQKGGYWMPDRQRIHSMMAQYFDVQQTDSVSGVVNPRSLRVAIQNSTGNDKANLQTLIKALQKLGYTNVYVAKSWGEPLEETHIVAQQGDGNTAESIRNTLGFGEVRVESTGNLGSDISIQVGKDWLRQTQINQNPVEP